MRCIRNGMYRNDDDDDDDDNNSFENTTFVVMTAVKSTGHATSDIVFVL